jgi:Domain of unknown function (DUF6475)
MEIHDMPAFAQVMASLGELYGKPVSGILVDLYWNALKRFDIHAIRQALHTHINNPDRGQFMPKPADLMRYLEGSANTKALQAWSKVIYAMKHHGQYESLVFDDVLIHAVIHDMGGWIELCQVSDKELPFRTHEFERRYESYLLRRPTTYPKQLMGLVEINNSARGFELKPPILIGNEQRALKVYLGGHDNTILIQHKPLSLELIKQLEHQQVPALNKQESHHDVKKNDSISKLEFINPNLRE